MARLFGKEHRNNVQRTAVEIVISEMEMLTPKEKQEEEVPRAGKR
ncbi:hypothetical protein KSF_105500 [Reticulibacter mediterranei]|uniref:Uncharacterized protein n=1 Tax=Reticulibacter mediterranei TaxID=2778369 RepID=A0A8J3NAL7_9CHLR|nr:hypothetical protein [Reticulibacter mediterranei]GHP00503.1 hypothetical protein KSF_105500 [Reticulibacter mediterranei]